MSADLNYLTPRGLLVNKQFVCQGASFSSLILAIDKMIEVPHNKETMAQKFNFSPDAFDAVNRPRPIGLLEHQLIGSSSWMYLKTASGT